MAGTIKNKDAFESYRFNENLSLYKFFAVFISAFNLFLLVPDIFNLNGPAMWPVIAMRLSYSLLLFSSLLWMGRIKNHIFRALITTGLELLALMIFLLVFWLYPKPDYLINMFGVMAIVLIAFVVPNLLSLALCVSVLAAASYISAAAVHIQAMPLNQLFAGIVYLVFEIIVCAVFFMIFHKNHYREFVAKTELERIYSTDPLTKVGNRVKLEEEADKWLAECERAGLPLSVVLMDVDNLKRINDVHGHLVGDTVLYEIAQILRANLRKNDVCVRWGGDEFVLLLPHMDAGQASELAARVKDAVSRYDFSAHIEISCSFGIAQMMKGQSIEQMIGLADRLMYRAKERGKNMIEVCGAYNEI